MKLSTWRALRSRYGRPWLTQHIRDLRRIRAQAYLRATTAQLAFDNLYPIRKEPPCLTS